MIFLIDHVWIWLVVAVSFSLFWGFYGLVEEDDKKSKDDQERLSRCVRIAGIFISEFLGSLIGWICLYFLVYRVFKLSVDLGVFDVFLGTVAIVGITGFFHQIVQKLG